ncbi:putative serine/threonine-protein kinase [Platanthera guangdongensis]|uniref:Serine/threonine-protein kinase n=1 Tax=Platanthera guangdongensis TaxID=2320717 RepID=A0ABR2MC35_9ASPA
MAIGDNAYRAVGHIGWGRWCTLAELEAAIDDFLRWNVIGDGGHNVAYRGVLPDLTIFAVKNLLNKKQVSIPLMLAVEIIDICSRFRLHLVRQWRVDSAGRNGVFESEGEVAAPN